MGRWLGRVLEELRQRAVELWPLPWQLIDDQDTRRLVAELDALLVCVNTCTPYEVSFYLLGEPLLEQRFASLAEAFVAGYTALYSATRIPPPLHWRAPPDLSIA